MIDGKAGPDKPTSSFREAFDAARELISLCLQLVSAERDYWKLRASYSVAQLRSAVLFGLVALVLLFCALLALVVGILLILAKLVGIILSTLLFVGLLVGLALYAALCARRRVGNLKDLE